jgi:fermentation-respiration switch protein FrsA (DUF1100 family)
MSSLALKLLSFAAVTVVVFIAGGFLFAHWAKQQSLFFPERYPTGLWNHRGTFQPQDFTFLTGDGVKLHAWHFAAADPSAPLLVWFHGNGGNLTYRADTCERLARSGISVFIFDYRGYGRSEGSPSERGLHGDSIAAYDFAVKELGRGRPIILYGESLGGPYAADVARKRPSCCVIIENSFPSLAEAANLFYAPLPLGFFVPRSLRTADWLNAAGRPVLVMHSLADQVLPYRLGSSLYEGLRVAKEMYISENAAHSMIPVDDGPRFEEAVVRFVKQHCGE